MRNLHRSLLKTSETPPLDFRPEKVKSSFQASFSEKENNPQPRALPSSTSPVPPSGCSDWIPASHLQHPAGSHVTPSGHPISSVALKCYFPAPLPVSALCSWPGHTLVLYKSPDLATYSVSPCLLHNYCSSQEAHGNASPTGWISQC